MGTRAAIVVALGSDRTPLYWAVPRGSGGAKSGGEGWSVRGTFPRGCELASPCERASATLKLAAIR